MLHSTSLFALFLQGPSFSDILHVTGIVLGWLSLILIWLPLCVVTTLFGLGGTPKPGFSGEAAGDKATSAWPV